MIAVIGIGNPLKKDDNIGNLLIDMLEKEIKEKDFLFIKAYLAPENYLLSLKNHNPKTIFFIDAVDFEGEIGEVKEFSLEDIKNMGKMSTHSIPITVYKNFFPKTEIILIGIKVKDADFGEELTKELKSKLEDIKEEVKDIILR